MYPKNVKNKNEYFQFVRRHTAVFINDACLSEQQNYELFLTVFPMPSNS